jgi:uncharacterized membrane protein
VAGRSGVLPGAAAALAGALAGQRARQALADRTGWPDVRCGLTEDAAAVTVAGVAAR